MAILDGSCAGSSRLSHHPPALTDAHIAPHTPSRTLPARPLPAACCPLPAAHPPPPLPTTAHPPLPTHHCPAHRNAKIRPQASPRRRVSVHHHTPPNTPPPQKKNTRRTLTPNPTPNPDRLDSNGPLILSSPFISSLLFQNDASDARDHCANERSLWPRSSTLPCSYQLHPCLRN